MFPLETLEPNPVVPAWLQIAAAASQVLSTFGVLVALATLMWQLRKDRTDRDVRDAQAIEDRRRHEAQIATLRQAEDDRLAAQARLIIPAAYRGNMFSPTLWNLRIDNWSMGAVSELGVAVIIKDAQGNAVPHGYRLANKESVGQAMAAMILPEMSRTLDGMEARYSQLVAHIRENAATLTENPEQLAALEAQFDANVPPLVSPEIAAGIKDQIDQAVQLQFTDDWSPILYAARFQAMAIETTNAEYVPHIRITYQDLAGYRWERTDTEGPKRVSQRFS